ncbi:MAG: hypothetical protein K6D96_06655 [Acetatifactor sp.]|nr:hypothetical protein [Acetatifactor sp.]
MLKVEKTNKEKNLAKLRTYEFCLYMMLESYFRKSFCRSKFLEANLLLYYRELPNDRAYKYEEEMLYQIEKIIMPNVIAKYLDDNAEVFLHRKDSFSPTVIVTKTRHLILTAWLEEKRNGGFELKFKQKYVE